MEKPAKRQRKPKRTLEEQLQLVQERRKNDLALKETKLGTALDLQLRDAALYFISNGEDINGKNEWGMTALHTAAYENQLPNISFLIRNGANLEANDKEGHPPIFNAIERGHLKALKRLLRAGAKADTRSSNGWTPLHEACYANRAATGEMIKLLLAYGANPKPKASRGLTALHIAASITCFESIGMLVAAGADVHSADANGMFPLHYARNIYAVQDLIKYDADADAQDKSGNTALHMAAKREMVDVIKELIKCGARTDIKNDDNKTYLELLIPNSHEIDDPPHTEATYIPGEHECGICFESKHREALSPCGHFLCSDCLRKLTNKKCPVCRRVIVSTIKQLYQ